MRYLINIIFIAVLILTSCSEPTYKLVPQQPVVIEKPVIEEVQVPTLTGTLELDWPIKDHIITSPFGYRNDLKKSGIGGGDSIHPGVDIIPSDRTLIHALIHVAAPGKVMFVYTAKHPHPVYGICAFIQHDSGMKWSNGKTVYLYTLYAHLSQLWVGRGDTLDRGDVVGKMGNTGQAEGYHLHFGVTFDPLDFLP
jgi:murein DD-endopeptidase MepM/ murein hydrolase activator NlpD